MRQTIRLTESELRNLIEESVNEAMINEGLKGAWNSMFGRARNQVTQTGQNLQTKVNDLYGRAKDYATKQAGKVAKGYNNYKIAAQIGSINQDAQNAIANIKNSINKLQQLDKQMQNISGQSMIDQNQLKTLADCSNSIINIGTNFGGQNNYMMNPNNNAPQPQ